VSFSDDVQKYAGKAGKSVDETMRAIALELFGSIIKDTPVDTGRARGNWQTSIGAPAAGEVDRLGEGEAIKEVSATVADFSGGKVIYLANNLVYIKSLEEGGSDQAPAGMIRKNIVRIQQIVKKAASDNKV